MLDELAGPNALLELLGIVELVLRGEPVRLVELIGIAELARVVELVGEPLRIGELVGAVELVGVVNAPGPLEADVARSAPVAVLNKRATPCSGPEVRGT